MKYEYDRKINKIVVDRILREGFRYPANYWFIDKTLDWDGDELDVLIYSNESFLPGTICKCKIVDALEMIDNGEINTKLIVMHSDDYRLDHIKNLNDIPSVWTKKCKTFFSSYKNWKKPEITKIIGFKDAGWGTKEYQECVALFKKYESLSKDEFINKMKMLHSSKYSQKLNKLYLNLLKKINETRNYV